MSQSVRRGPLGSPTNSPKIDAGTLVRGESQAPGILGFVDRLFESVGDLFGGDEDEEPQRVRMLVPPIHLTPLAIDEELEPKWKVGEKVYWELGLVGQIAEKFLSVPYRKGGRIEFKTGKLKGKGLVCTSFAKIFGALWFADSPLRKGTPVERQERLDAREVDVRQRTRGESGKEWKIVEVRGKKRVVGESDTKEKAKARAKLRNDARLAVVDKEGGKEKKGLGLSPAQVYAGKYGSSMKDELGESTGDLVNADRLKLKDLVDLLSTERLYAVVKYKKKAKETYVTKSGKRKPTRLHILFLIYSGKLGWLTIESKGSLSGRGSGSGPGIYKLKKPYENKNYYQAWDWGKAIRPRDTDIDAWSYSNEGG